MRTLACVLIAGVTISVAGTALAQQSPGRDADRAPQLRPSSMDDGSQLQMPPIAVAPPERDSRSLVWIGGVLVLAAVFLWNRSRRLELERLEAAQSRRERRAGDRMGAFRGRLRDSDRDGRDDDDDDDDDASDLAAAAQADFRSSPDSPATPKEPRS